MDARKDGLLAHHKRRRFLASFSGPGKYQEEKNVLGPQTLIYQSYTVQHFDTEGRWRSHGSEESSSEEARKKSGEEEVVVP
jgi:hypothetical protein